MKTMTAILMDTILREDYESGIRRVPDGSVDLILTDPPYGVTACAWDKRPDLEAMWREFNRIVPDRGAIVVTATQPFATDVINANRRFFRYDLVWAKSNPVGFLNARRMPLRQHELVLVFYRKLPVYNPQMVPGEIRVSGARAPSDKPGVYARYKTLAHESHERYPTSLLPFDKDGAGEGRHPTQKPLSLFEYLVRTYSAPGALVFDPFMGSGTTALAARRTGRRYLGFELDEAYHRMAQQRLDGVEPIPGLADSALPCMN
ncbi:MAG: hypothetical protein A2Y38_20145 [Spirochaetes bacterium GWB1_59_5]|nr:MAG: hypothetical protein A2Y38_20145 [Spirochaetes bacterium GWB1_59_5]